MKPMHFCLLAIALFSGSAMAMDLSGSVSIHYSDGTAKNVAGLHVFAVDKSAMDKYLKPLLPDAEKKYAVRRAEFTDLVLNYSPGMTDAEKKEYERKKKELFESFDGILPSLITGFPGKTIASTTTDDDGKYQLAISGEFYIVVLASVEDEGMTVHHIWLVPSSEIVGQSLILNQGNQIPSVTSLYKKFYP